MNAATALSEASRLQFAELLDQHRRMVFKVANTYARASDRDDLAMLGAEPTLGNEPGGLRDQGGHAPSGTPLATSDVVQSRRNRTIGHGMPPSTQWWSATSMTRPMLG